MGILDNLEAYLEYQDKDKSEVGFATGKWSDDDDYKGPITPFMGPIR
jgi:hypothetical protein